jgi:hypothetical protein
MTTVVALLLAMILCVLSPFFARTDGDLTVGAIAFVLYLMAQPQPEPAEEPRVHSVPAVPPQQNPAPTRDWTPPNAPRQYI